YRNYLSVTIACPTRVPGARSGQAGATVAGRLRHAVVASRLRRHERRETPEDSDRVLVCLCRSSCLREWTRLRLGPMRSHERWTLAATIVGSSMTFVDATVVNVALPVLQADLHATITDVQWVIEAYALFLGALILVGGSLGDQFGRKRVFLGGVAVFTAASVLCGVATSPRALIAARAL